jgi:hypothetical protein
VFLAVSSGVSKAAAAQQQVRSRIPSSCKNNSNFMLFVEQVLARLTFAKFGGCYCAAYECSLLDLKPVA